MRERITLVRQTGPIVGRPIGVGSSWEVLSRVVVGGVWNVLRGLQLETPRVSKANESTRPCGIYVVLGLIKKEQSLPGSLGRSFFW